MPSTTAQSVVLDVNGEPITANTVTLILGQTGSGKTAVQKQLMHKLLTPINHSKVLWVNLYEFTNDEAGEFSMYDDFYVYGTDCDDALGGINTFTYFANERVRAWDLDNEINKDCIGEPTDLDMLGITTQKDTPSNKPIVYDQHIHLAIDDVSMVFDSTKSNTNTWVRLNQIVPLLRKLNMSYSATSGSRTGYTQEFRNSGIATVIDMDALQAKR